MTLVWRRTLAWTVSFSLSLFVLPSSAFADWGDLTAPGFLSGPSARFALLAVVVCGLGVSVVGISALSRMSSRSASLEAAAADEPSAPR